MEYLSYASLVLQFVSLWLVFEKASVKGWKALIPFYNTYVKGEIVGKKKIAIANIICALVGFVFLAVSIIGYVAAGSLSLDSLDQSDFYYFLTSFGVMGILSAVLLIVADILDIVLNCKLVSSFTNGEKLKTLVILGGCPLFYLYTCTTVAFLVIASSKEYSYKKSVE